MFLNAESHNLITKHQPNKKHNKNKCVQRDKLIYNPNYYMVFINLTHYIFIKDCKNKQFLLTSNFLLNNFYCANLVNTLSIVRKKSTTKLKTT